MDRATPVEAVDQRSEMVWFQLLDLRSTPTGRLVPSTNTSMDLAVIESRAIFGLHEPAGRADAKDVQIVLHAAADEPAIAVEAVGVGTRGSAGKIEQGLPDQ